MPVTVKDRKGETLVDEDEEPKRVQLDKLASLRPAFSRDGTVTAANASTLNDGAAALLVTSAEVAKARGYNVLARIVADSTAAVEPKWFTIAPVHALAKLYEKTKSKPLDWDLYEINEAFSGVTMAAMKEHGHPARSRQRARRRGLARSPDRLLRRARGGDAAERTAPARQEEGHRNPVHRRRRSGRDGRGADLACRPRRRFSA